MSGLAATSTSSLGRVCKRTTTLRSGQCSLLLRPCAPQFVAQPLSSALQREGGRQLGAFEKFVARPYEARAGSSVGGAKYTRPTPERTRRRCSSCWHSASRNCCTVMLSSGRVMICAEGHCQPVCHPPRPCSAWASAASTTRATRVPTLTCTRATESAPKRTVSPSERPTGSPAQSNSLVVA